MKNEVNVSAVRAFVEMLYPTVISEATKKTKNTTVGLNFVSFFVDNFFICGSDGFQSFI